MAASSANPTLPPDANGMDPDKVHAYHAYDLTSQLSRHLDRHMIVLLVEYQEEKQMYPEIDIQRAKLKVLDNTQMVIARRETEKRIAQLKGEAKEEGLEEERRMKEESQKVSNRFFQSAVFGKHDVLIARDTFIPNEIWPAKTLSLNDKNPASKRYAILDKLENYKDKEKIFEFKLLWPGTEFQSMHWKQSSNPCHDEKTTGFHAIECPYSGFGGLTKATDGKYILKANDSDSFYIGRTEDAKEEEGLKGPDGSQVSKVELYAISNGQEILVARDTYDTSSTMWPEGTLAINTEDPDSDKFSIMDQIEKYRGPTDKRFELKLSWLTSDLQTQHWKQLTNPVDPEQKEVKGFVPVSCPHGTKFGGLVRCLPGDGYLLKAKSGEGFNIGKSKDEVKGKPGPNGKDVQSVELYAVSAKSWIPIIAQSFTQDLNIDDDRIAEIKHDEICMEEKSLKVLYSFSRFAFDCGQYLRAWKGLELFRALNTNEEALHLAQWGVLAAAINDGMEERLIIDEIKALKEAIDRRTHVPMLHQLMQRAWLVNWSLFVYMLSEEQAGPFIRFVLQDKMLNAIQIRCPYILRYIVVAFMVSYEQTRDYLSQIIDVIEIEREHYRDPLTEFMRCLIKNYDFEGAHRELLECKIVFEVDYFLSRNNVFYDKFFTKARDLMFELYCRIHKRIDMSVLAKRLDIEEKDPDAVIVDLIKSVPFEGKIDSSKNQLVIATHYPTIHQKVIEKTKSLAHRTQLIVEAINKRMQARQIKRD